MQIRTIAPQLTIALLLAGCNSSDGNDGTAGLMSLVKQEPMAIFSAECPYGGITMSSGMDMNRNGVLDENEETSEDVICDSADSAAMSGKLRDMLAEDAITGDPSAGRDLPAIDDPLARLGMQLFFTKAMGGDQDSACVACHHPFLGGTDRLTQPIGVGAESPDLLGPGRRPSAQAADFDGGPNVPRNSPTTFNLGMWDKVLFHDGRLESLAKVAGAHGAGDDIRTPDVAFGTADPAPAENLSMAQARFPMTVPEEMLGFEYAAGQSNDAIRERLQARFNGSADPVELAQNNWLDAFQIGFSAPGGTAEELITFTNIARALSTYMRSQVFVNSGLRRFIEGDDNALSGPAKLGAMLFYGSAGCARCHSGDFMTDEQFHVLAIPQLGRGKGDDNGTRNDDDFGRFRETGVEADRYAFRTPSLLNVAVTAPYGHSGAYHSLEAVVQHHLNPAQSVADYDINQLEPGVQTDGLNTNTQFALDQLAQLRSNGSSQLPDLSLNEQEIQWLVAFLEELTDPCLQDKACIGRWVPGVNDPDPDGLRLRATDRLGNPTSL